jgi:hypothetical protein
MKSFLLVLAVLMGSNFALASKNQSMDKNKPKMSEEQKKRFQRGKPNPDVKKAVEDCKQQVGFKAEKGKKPSKEMIDKMRSCMQGKMGRKPVIQKNK